MADLSSNIDYWDTLKSKSIVTECNVTVDNVYFWKNPWFADNGYDISTITFEELENAHEHVVLNENYLDFFKYELDNIVPDNSKTMLCIGIPPTIFNKMKTVFNRPIKNILLSHNGTADSDTIYDNVKSILNDDSQINNVNIVWYETGHWSLFDETNLAIFNYAKQYLSLIHI